MAQILSASIESAGLKNALAQFGQSATRQLAAGLYQEGEGIMTAAKLITPVDTGALRASGQVHQPTISGQSVEVILGFGNSSVDYALVQHEHLEYHHTVGGPKFLERPFLAAIPGMADRIAARMRF